MNAPDTPFAFDAAIREAAERVNPRVVAWRRDFHENPELGNREVRTAGVVAKHLRIAHAAVRLVSGRASKMKLLEVEGLDDDEVARRLGLAPSDASDEVSEG